MSLIRSERLSRESTGNWWNMGHPFVQQREKLFGKAKVSGEVIEALKHIARDHQHEDRSAPHTPKCAST